MGGDDKTPPSLAPSTGIAMIHDAEMRRAMQADIMHDVAGEGKTDPQENRKMLGSYGPLC